MGKALWIVLLLALISMARCQGKEAVEKEPCAYDGMVMSQEFLPGSATYKGEQLRFCLKKQVQEFMRHPERFRNVISTKDYRIVVNTLTRQEFMRFMKDFGMKMKGEMKGSHRVSASVYDRRARAYLTDAKVTLLLTSGGKQSAFRLSWMPMMKYYGLDVTLPPGEQKISLLVEAREKKGPTHTLRGGFPYKVSSEKPEMKM